MISLILVLYFWNIVYFIYIVKNIKTSFLRYCTQVGLHLGRFDPSRRLIEPTIWIYAGLFAIKSQLATSNWLRQISS